MNPKHFSAFFLFALSFLGVSSGCAQVVESAIRPAFSLTVGGTASIFNPDYVSQKLSGVGAYVDLNLTRRFGVEAEGRWQRFHEFEGISQDNYLIGPRMKVKHFWRAQPYVKVLGGLSHMTFEDGIATGRFTTFAAGGGVDLKLSRRWSVRAIDAEYQVWPSFLGSWLSPYGVSAGIGYRIF